MHADIAGFWRERHGGDVATGAGVVGGVPDHHDLGVVRHQFGSHGQGQAGVGAQQAHDALATELAAQGRWHRGMVACTGMPLAPASTSPTWMFQAPKWAAISGQGGELHQQLVGGLVEDRLLGGGEAITEDDQMQAGAFRGARDAAQVIFQGA